MRRYAFSCLFFIAAISNFSGCGGGTNSEAKFEGAPPVSAEEQAAADDYNKQMMENQKKMQSQGN